MWSEKCPMDEVLHDIYVYVWNDDLNKDQFLDNLYNRWLYMLRDINNLGITLYEDIPQH